MTNIAYADLVHLTRGFYQVSPPEAAPFIVPLNPVFLGICCSQLNEKDRVMLLSLRIKNTPKFLHHGGLVFVYELRLGTERILSCATDPMAKTPCLVWFALVCFLVYTPCLCILPEPQILDRENCSSVAPFPPAPLCVLSPALV